MRKKIFSIDGGGIRGVLPAAFLAEIETSTGKRVADYFDLIVGTSAGGIVALGLGLGVRPSAIVSFFEEHGPNIFRPGVSGRYSSLFLTLRAALPFLRGSFDVKYDSGPLRNALETIFGDKKLGDSASRLVIPAFDRERGELHVFKTYHHKRLKTDYKQAAVDVALSTSAAPTFFSAHELRNGISLIDGGVWANNPANVGVVEAIGMLDYPRDSLYVLSVGCSESVLSIPASSGALRYASKVVDLFVRGQSKGSLGMAMILTGHTYSNQRVFRIDHTVKEGEAKLDSVTQLSRWKGAGASLARSHYPEVAGVFFDQPCEKFVPEGV